MLMPKAKNPITENLIEHADRALAESRAERADLERARAQAVAGVRRLQQSIIDWSIQRPQSKG
jgi:hypothetical protein